MLLGQKLCHDSHYSTIPFNWLLAIASRSKYINFGAKPGKKVYLQANLHGAEIAGNAVVYQLISFDDGE